ncbi:MAG TPA: hypothetical protein VF789_26635 [Thermoanaerobaculia bacterium]
MLRNLSIRLTLSAFLLVPLSLAAENQVPRTIRISGTLTELSASTVPSQETIRFTLYQDQEGTTPLWSETQTVEVAPLGRYTVLLGAETEGGIPLPLFSSMDAHWLGVQLEGQHEQLPVMLVSVPYALKAADAETLGGWPASSFLRAEKASEEPPPAEAKAGRQFSAIPKALVPIYGPNGSAPINYLAKFTAPATIGPSVLYDNGYFLGLRTIAPRTDFDLNGTLAVNRVTLAQDSTTSSSTWSLDNSSSRFRLFYQPAFNANGTEILTASSTDVDVIKALNVHGFLTAINRLRTNEIEFPNPDEPSYPYPPPPFPPPFRPYYKIDSRGTSFNIYSYNWFMTANVLLPSLNFTLQGGGLGVPGRAGLWSGDPRSNLDVGGEIIATSRLLLARDTSAASPAWHMVNDASLFRLAHQSSLTPQGQVGTTVMVATESNRVGIGVDQPGHTLDVGGDVAIVGTGHGIVFPDGTVQTSASPPGAFFGICISNSAGPQTCSCPRLLSQTQISAGQSCSIAGVPGNCTAVSQAGPPVTYGACCVCN